MFNLLLVSVFMETPIGSNGYNVLIIVFTVQPNNVENGWILIRYGILCLLLIDGGINIVLFIIFP